MKTNEPDKETIELKSKIEKLKSSITDKDKEMTELKKKICELEEKIINKDKEIKEYKDKSLRILAEMNNFKKSMEDRQKEFIEYANAGFIEKLLPLLDHFYNALQKKGNMKDAKAFYDGISMIYKEFITVLEKEGLKVQDAVGRKFDPFKYEAIQEYETNEFEEGVIVEEVMRGYEYKDRILRPAMVKVAKKKLEKKNGKA